MEGASKQNLIVVDVVLNNRIETDAQLNFVVVESVKMAITMSALFLELLTKTSQELRMLSSSLFIQGSQCKC